MSTNVEKVVKISPVVVETFSRICQFLPFRPKRCSCYWTDLDKICTRCS